MKSELTIIFQLSNSRHLEATLMITLKEMTVGIVLLAILDFTTLGQASGILNCLRVSTAHSEVATLYMEETEM